MIYVDLIATHADTGDGTVVRESAETLEELAAACDRARDLLLLRLAEKEKNGEPE